MQFFAAIPALFGAGGGAAATTAATAGAAGSSLFSASTLFTGLQIGGSVLGAMAALRSGQEQAAAMQAQAAQANSDAGQAAIDGESRRLSMRKKMLAELGDQDVAYAASGLDLSFGTAADARAGAIRDASSALTRDSGNQLAQQQSLWNRAAALRRSAKEARRGGLLKAIGIGIDTGVDLYNRG